MAKEDSVEVVQELEMELEAMRDRRVREEDGSTDNNQGMRRSMVESVQGLCINISQQFLGTHKKAILFLFFAVTSFLHMSYFYSPPDCHLKLNIKYKVWSESDVHFHLSGSYTMAFV